LILYWFLERTVQRSVLDSFGRIGDNAEDVTDNTGYNVDVASDIICGNVGSKHDVVVGKTCCSTLQIDALNSVTSDNIEEVTDNYQGDDSHVIHQSETVSLHDHVGDDNDTVQTLPLVVDFYDTNDDMHNDNTASLSLPLTGTPLRQNTNRRRSVRGDVNNEMNCITEANENDKFNGGFAELVTDSISYFFDLSSEKKRSQPRL